MLLFWLTYLKTVIIQIRVTKTRTCTNVAAPVKTLR